MMKCAKMKIIQLAMLGVMLLVQVPFVQASRIFVSNNEKIISPSGAFKRLHDGAQSSLQYNTISTLQNFHFQQGRIHQALGMYYMQHDSKITADNTLIFTTSPKENVQKRTIIQTAASLAKQFRQESVAIFIDSANFPDYDTVITFDGKAPLYSDIKQKMKALKSQGLSSFSMYFQKDKKYLDKSRVSSIEWLTSRHIGILLKKYFKDFRVRENHGEALLVFQDGHIEQII